MGLSWVIICRIFHHLYIKIWMNFKKKKSYRCYLKGKEVMKKKWTGVIMTYGLERKMKTDWMFAFPWTVILVTLRQIWTFSTNICRRCLSRGVFVSKVKLITYFLCPLYRLIANDLLQMLFNKVCTLIIHRDFTMKTTTYKALFFLLLNMHNTTSQSAVWPILQQEK